VVIPQNVKKSQNHCTLVLSLSPVVGIGTPSTPHPERVCSPPLWLRGEGHTRWLERGWESPNSDEVTTLWYSTYISTLWFAVTLCDLLTTPASRPRTAICRAPHKNILIFVHRWTRTQPQTGLNGASFHIITEATAVGYLPLHLSALKHQVIEPRHPSSNPLPTSRAMTGSNYIE